MKIQKKYTKRLFSQFFFLNLFYIFLVLYNNAICQNNIREAWVQYYASPDSFDVATALAVDQQGNTIITGFSPQGLASLQDYTTIKYGIDGSENWVSQYDGPRSNNDNASDIVVDNMGNVYVTGSSWGNTSCDITTIKYNSVGIEQWIARHNAPSNNSSQGFALALDYSENIYVTGLSYGISGGSDYVTIKYNNDGVEQWVATYNGPANTADYATCICIDDSGYIYITGESRGNGTEWDYATIKYDSSGFEKWVARYNGIANKTDRVQSIAIDDSGNVYVTGSSEGFGVHPLDYLTIKYSPNGVEKWVARYDAYSGPLGGDDYATDISVDKFGNVHVTGYSYDPDNGSPYGDYTTIKYDNSGTILWISRYGSGNGGDVAKAIVLDDSGNVYVTGESSGLNTNIDIATVKYNSTGLEKWVINYKGGLDDIVFNLALDDSANIIITGYSDFITSNLLNGRKMITIKYEQRPPVGIRNKDNDKILKDFYIQNFPNPFNPSTRIKFNLPTTEKVKIEVFNLLGIKIETLLNKFVPKGLHEIEFTSKNLPSGVYLYRINAGGYMKVNKMLLIK